MSLRAWSGLICETEFEEVGVLLDGKNAVIYGGGGSIGSAVARGFAHEGARVFLAGRTAASLEAVAEEIRRTGRCNRFPR